MSATQTLCDAFAYLSDGGSGCPYDAEACRACPIEAARTDADGTCQEAFARLLMESRGEPWEGTAEGYGLRGAYCSLCRSGIPDGAAECPTCGAAIRRTGR